MGYRLESGQFMINGALACALSCSFSHHFYSQFRYLGYQYVWELETYLRIGQEQTMVGTARAVATAMHERPKLFDVQSLL